MSNPLNRHMSEAALMRTIVEAAERLGYLVHHETDSRLSAPGLPDLEIVGHGRHWKLELKTMKGKLRDEQRVWLRELQRAGIDARIVRPDDLDDILAELQRSAA